MSKDLNLKTPAYNITRVGIDKQRDTTLGEWRQYGDALRAIDEAKQWAIGDWLVDGKSHYGDGLYEEASKLLGLDIKYLSEQKRIAEHFKFHVRRGNLGFEYHKQVASIKELEEVNGKLQKGDYDLEKQQSLLKQAEKHKLTVKELRQVASAYKAQQKRDMALFNAPEKYQVVYADPPWQYGPQNPQGGYVGSVNNDEALEAKEYPTMAIEDICSMPIDKRTTDNAVLFLWATNPMLEKALRVINAWGFDYKTNMVWKKTDLKRPGSGYYIRGRHELLLIATKGSFTPLDKNIAPPIGSVLESPVREHSRKPDEVYGIIEKLYPDVKYLELFARNEQEGWDVWGDEI